MFDAKKKKELHQFELSNLKNSSQSPIRDRTLSEGFDTVIHGANPRITNEIVPQVSGDDFRKSIAAKRIMAKLGKLGKPVLGALPLVGGAMQAFESGDALAAIDPMDSEVANLGSDEPYLKEEALMEQPYENFADKDVSEQARRWQKIRSILDR